MAHMPKIVIHARGPHRPNLHAIYKKLQQGPKASPEVGPTSNVQLHKTNSMQTSSSSITTDLTNAHRAFGNKMNSTGRFTFSMLLQKHIPPIEFTSPRKLQICRRLNRKDEIDF